MAAFERKKGIENEVNSIENSYNECIVSTPKILQLRTA